MNWFDLIIVLGGWVEIGLGNSVGLSGIQKEKSEIMFIFRDCIFKQMLNAVEHFQMIC